MTNNGHTHNTHSADFNRKNAKKGEQIAIELAPHKHEGSIADGSDLDPTITEIAPGVLEIDTKLGGWEHVTAGYLLTGERPFLVETGSRSSMPTLKKAFTKLSLSPNDLYGVAVTHIHLDHAGGVGDVSELFPKATVYVHPLGAKHLVDPTRLIDSASRVYGPLLDSLYGRLLPTEKDRIKVLEDSEIIDLKTRTLKTVDSPGHAKHHLALLDSSSEILFAGDAVGVRLPDIGILRPSSPPSDFDLIKAVNSLNKFKENNPYKIALAHYGLVAIDPQELLDEAIEIVTKWAEVAERAFLNQSDITDALTTAFGGSFDNVDPKHKARMETLSGIHSNASGLKRWLEVKYANTNSTENKNTAGGKNN